MNRAEAALLGIVLICLLVLGLALLIGACLTEPLTLDQKIEIELGRKKRAGEVENA
jgi:hypothetical protein